MPQNMICVHGHQWNSNLAEAEVPPTCPQCGAPAKSRQGRQPEAATVSDLQETRDFTPGQPSVDPYATSDKPLAPATTIEGARKNNPSVQAQAAIPGYEILGELGRGGMGVVYKARQSKLKRLVALKMILAGAHAGSAELERFRLEAEAIARMQHPNIVQIHEVGNHDGKPFFSLEYVDGGNLRDKLAGTPLPARKAARLVETLAQAMHAAHEHGIVHRDLKPANVLMTKDGVPKITDFGLAKQLGQDSGQTHTGQVMGTPSYMAPEQASGNVKSIGPVTDIYALGALLYELLTGRPPFKAATVHDTLDQVRNQEPVPPSQLQPKTPRDLETICLKCLHKERGRRYASAAALAEDLGRFLAGEPIAARPTSVWERAAKWAKRRPAVAAVYALSVLVLVFGVGGGGVLSQWLEADAARGQAEKERGLAVEARTQADQARAAAVVAQQEEAKARTIAEEAQKAVEVANQQTERVLYFRRVDLAHREWSANNVRRARQLLDESPADQRGWEWGYVQRLSRPEILSLDDHKGKVDAVALSKNGKYLASAGWDGTVRVWDLPQAKQVHVFPHGPIARAVAFSPDSLHLAAAADGGIRVWDLASGAEVHVVKLPHFVACVAYSHDGKKLAFGGQFAGIWDLALGRQVLSIKGHTDQVWSVAFSPDDNRLVTSSWDKTVRIWDVRTGTEPVTLQQFMHTKALPSITIRNNRMWCAAFSPDGTLVAAAGADRATWIWKADTGTPIAELRGHEAAINHLAFHPDGLHLATASDDRTIRLYHIRMGKEMTVLRGHFSTVQHLAFSAGGGRLASASRDGTVKLWNTLGPSEAHILNERRPLEVHLVAFSPRGQRLASVCTLDPDTPGGKGADEVRLWDLSTKKVVYTIPGAIQRAGCVAFSPDGATLATVGPDLSVRLRDADKGTELRRIPLVQPATCVAFSPAGKTLAIALLSQVQIHDVEDGRELRTYKAPDGSGPISLSYSRDGRYLAAVYRKGATIWDLSDGSVFQTFPAPLLGLLSVALNPAGTRLATGARDGTVTVYDARSGRVVYALAGYDRADSVAFSADGTRLVSTDGDLVKVWDADTGQEAITLRGHGNVVSSVAFSPDGKQLASGSYDGMVRLWAAADLGADKRRPVLPEDNVPAPTPVKPGLEPRIRFDFSATGQFGFSVIDERGTPQRIIYDPKGKSNITLIKMDGVPATFGSPAGIKLFDLPKGPDGKARHGRTCVWMHGKLRVTQTVTALAANKDGPPDTGLVTYEIKNQGDKPHQVGLRLLLDTYIADVDGHAFANNKDGADQLITTSADFKTRADVPTSVRAIQKADLKNPGLVAHLTLKVGGAVQSPDRVILTHWPKEHALKWDVPVAPINDDAAVVLYWNPEELGPGESRTVGFSYGLGRIILDK